jgi:hypothetical protein
MKFEKKRGGAIGVILMFADRKTDRHHKAHRRLPQSFAKEPEQVPEEAKGSLDTPHRALGFRKN